MPSNEICNIMHNINIIEHAEKKINQFLNFNIQNQFEILKKLFPLYEQDHMLNHGEINIQIYKKLVNMGLSKDFFFSNFLLDLKIDEKTYILGLCYTIINQFYF